MEPFRLNIPVLETVSEGIREDIEFYRQIAEEVKQCCEILTTTAWEGKARDQFVKNSEKWYNESQEFIEDLAAFYEILSAGVLPMAKELNEMVLRMPELLGGPGATGGDKNILSYNIDSHETIEYCYQRLMEDYDDSKEELAKARDCVSDLEYCGSTGRRLSDELWECMAEVESQKAKLMSMRSELRRYGEGIRALDEMVVSGMRRFEMPEGWTHEMVEIQRQFGGFGAFVTVEGGMTSYDWSGMKRYIDKKWPDLTEEEQKLLLLELEKAMEGKAVHGVDDPRQLLELLCLEEQGYLSIEQGTAACNTEYLAGLLDQLNNGLLSKRELSAIEDVIKRLQSEEIAVYIQMGVPALNELEKLDLELYLVCHKEELMAELLLVDDAAYERLRDDALIMLELWQGFYRDRCTEYELLSLEERLERYPFGGGTPQSDLGFLWELTGVPAEARLEILEELKNNDGSITLERILEIYPGYEEGTGGEASVRIAYSTNLYGMSLDEFLLQGYRESSERTTAGLNMILLPWSLEATYRNANPPPSHVSLDPDKSRFDSLEYESIYGPRQGPGALPGYPPVESIDKGTGQSNPNLQSIMDGLKDADVTYKVNPATGKVEPYMKQYQVNDDYKIVFRRDFDGFNTHDPAGNHWNFEVQTTGGRTVYDLHVYTDEAGGLLPFTDDNIYIPRKSPFNN